MFKQTEPFTGTGKDLAACRQNIEPVSRHWETGFVFILNTAPVLQHQSGKIEHHPPTTIGGVYPFIVNSSPHIVKKGDL